MNKKNIIRNNIFIIVGGSGVGKTTIYNQLKDKFKFDDVVNYTTREKRIDDDGQYNYVSVPTFMDLLEKGELVEYTYYHGNWYGIPKPKGTCLLILEPIGALQIYKLLSDNIDYRIRIISLHVGEKEKISRITNRGQNIERAMDRINHDRYIERFESYADRVFLNYNLDKCVKQIETYIQAVLYNK